MKRLYPVIPLIEQRAAAAHVAHRADPQTSEALGYPGELVDDWHERAVARLGELVSGNRALRVFMDSCTRCGACTDKCHYFLGTHDPNNMPVARQELLRSVWRRYHTWTGRWLPWLVGARTLTRELLDDWYRYFHQCSECRRCAVFCPKGIDTSELSMAGREILATVGLGQRYSQTIVEKAGRIGNNLGLKPAALVDVLENLEEDLLEETGVPVRLPLDEPGREVLLVVPSADFFAEPHVDGLIGTAKLLHAAGVSWTLSSHASEAANVGLFAGSVDHERALAERLVEALRTLGATRLVIGECGHAWRVAASRLPTLVGELPMLSRRRAEHLCELSAELVATGRVTLDASRNAEVVATYHDSCNVARGAMMGNSAEGAFELPRTLLRAAVPRLVEMADGATRRETFCCGGGGGLLSDELMALRVQGAEPRARALQAVVEQEAVTHLVAICAICKTQFSGVLPEHGLRQVRTASLHALVGQAVVLGHGVHGGRA